MNLLDSFRGSYNVGDIVLLNPRHRPIAPTPRTFLPEKFVQILQRVPVAITDENGAPLFHGNHWVYLIEIESQMLYICDDMIQYCIPNNKNLAIEV